MPKANPVKVTEREYHEHCNDYDGVCLACGEWKFGMVEPDARGYKCDNEECGAMQVMGTEQALLEGFLLFKD